MIRPLLCFADGERLPAQIQNDRAGDALRFPISFDPEWNSRHWRTRTAHKCHQRMHGRDRCPALPQHGKFVAGQSAAGVQRHSAAPIRRSRKGVCGVGNRSIGNTKPNDVRPNLRPIGRHGGCFDLSSQPPCSPQRRRPPA